MRLYKVCNKISLLLHALCSAAGYFLIEAISRHSFVEAWNYMTGKPLVFAYNAGLIFVTSLIAYLFRRRTFWRVLIAIFWLLLGIINGIILLCKIAVLHHGLRAGPVLKGLSIVPLRAKIQMHPVQVHRPLVVDKGPACSSCR